MNYVEPIRDRKKIAQIVNLLWGLRLYRDLLLFVVGFNTAQRMRQACLFGVHEPNMTEPVEGKETGTPVS